MSATEELRRMLDERGVKWWEEDGHTLWYGESTHHAASAFSSFLFGENERMHLNAMVTPAQAVEATLGRGTCHAANVAEYAWDDFECSECGWVTWSFLMEHEGCGTVCKPRYCPNCGAKVVE